MTRRTSASSRQLSASFVSALPSNLDRFIEQAAKEIELRAGPFPEWCLNGLGRGSLQNAEVRKLFEELGQDKPENEPEGFRDWLLSLSEPKVMALFSLAGYYHDLKRARWHLSHGRPAQAVELLLNYTMSAKARSWVELGKHTLQSQSVAGKADKRAKGILAAMMKAEIALRSEGTRPSTRELWDYLEKLVESDVFGSDGKQYEVYRDGEKIVQVRHADGRERAIGWRTFQRYHASIRRALDPSTQ